MRTSRTALLLIIAGLTGAGSAAAQTPAPPAPPSAPPPPAAEPPAAPPPAPPPPAPPPPASAPGEPGAAPAAAGAPAAPAAPWWDKFSADAFVDAYASLNFNFPKPQGQITPLAPLVGGNSFRAFDTTNGFALSWAGANVSYAADPIGFTVGLRVGPSANLYNAGPDASAGLQFIKQAYATWKAADKLVLDFGKWDEPFGSEVADSQLNMNYTRSMLFWWMQPLFFTGLRATIPVADQFGIVAFVANGWNDSVDINAGKAFGAQLMIKPVDQLVLYVGYVGSPEQPDISPNVPVSQSPALTSPPTTLTDQGTESNWRHLADLVVDFNPTKELRFLLNADYRAEDNVGSPAHSESAFGVNLAIRYAFTDAFYGTLRGEYLHDEHGDVLPTGAKTDAEDGTLTLAYGIGNHLALMLDGRLDLLDNNYFYKGSSLTDTTKAQFTTTLGIIASTK